MKNWFKSWEFGFYLVSLLLLVAIPFGYFIGSLAFSIWALYSFKWIVKSKNFKINKSILPFLLFSIVFFASLIWSQDSNATIHGITRQLPLLFFATVGMFLPVLPQNKVHKIIKIFAIFVSFLAIVLIIIAAFKYQKYQYKNFLF